MSRRPNKLPGRRRSRPKKLVQRRLGVTVIDVGSHGDGRAKADDGASFYIPFVLPGERLLVETGGPKGGPKGDGMAARCLAVETPSEARRPPPCPYFGTCGGCQLQHAAADWTASWKRRKIVTALARRGLAEVAVEETTSIGAGTRRRATLTWDRGRLGFSEAKSAAVVAVDHCLLLADGLSRLIGPLAKLLARGPWPRARVSLSLLEGGAEVVFEAATDPGLDWRRCLAQFAGDAGLARLCWRPAPDEEAEPVVQNGACRLTVGGARLEPPPAAFLQPSAEGEAFLIGAVGDFLAGAERVADLHCGLGGFALSLAGAGRRLLAVDADGAAIRALGRAAGMAGLGGRISTEIRDLTRRPLRADELKSFDCVVFDPPRAGALAQAQELAKAPGLVRIAGVSCNPATFARDARVLADGGFALERVMPLDQFPYSHHVELVGLFARRR